MVHTYGMPDTRRTKSDLVSLHPDNTSEQITAQTGRDSVISAVNCTPEASTDNVVQPTTAAVVPLIAKGAASQTADLQQFQNSSGTVLSRVDKDGNFIGNVTGNLTGNADTATTATTAVSATTATTATNFTGSLSGDVTGTQSATVVGAVGGATAANVATATALANAATDANTASAIVKRDASGNFTATTITAALTGTASGNIPKADIIRVRQNGSYTAFTAASNTTTARGTALVTALASQTSGDVFLLGPGIFDIGTSQIDVNSCTLRGSGMYRTTIQCSNTSSARTNLQVGGTNFSLEDFTFWNTVSDGSYTFPVGRSGTGTASGNLRRIRILGNSDGLYFWCGSPTTITGEACIFQTTYDCFVNLSSGATSDLFTFTNCDFITTGPFPGTPSTISNDVVVVSAKCRFHTCRFFSTGTGSSTITSGIRLGAGTSYSPDITLHDCYFVTSAAAGQVSDINKDSGSGTVTIIGGYGMGTNGKITYVDAGSGTFRYQDTATAVLPRILEFVVFPPVDTVSTGDGKFYFHVPPALNGLNITTVHALVVTAGTTGTTDIQIARIRSGTPADVLSTKLTIDSTETGSDTAATAAVINTSNDDLATNDILRVDVDAVSTTAPLGLVVTIEAQA